MVGICVPYRYLERHNAGETVHARLRGDASREVLDMELRSAERFIEHFIAKIENGLLDLQPNFQRGE